MPAGNFSSSIQGFLDPNGFEQITGLNTVKGLTAPDGTKIAMIQADLKDVRWRDDGTVPTAAIGMLLVANDILIYSGNMAAIKFIEVAASAKLNITYYK